MGTTGLAVASLVTTYLLLLAATSTAKAGLLIQAPPKLSEAGNCDGGPCLISLLRGKRDDDPAPPEGDAAAAGDTTTAGDAAGAAPPADATTTVSGDPAPAAGSAGPVAGIGEIPLPPVTQQMPNLPSNFPYPDVKVVQEVPVPTKPRKKLIIGGGGGGGGGINPNQFPTIGPIEPEPAARPEEPAEVDPPVERESLPAPSKPDCNSGYGPPQDWRFPKARGHKKCPPTPPTNSVDDEDASVNLRTVQRDEEATGHTTVKPGKGSAMVSSVCSMGALLFAAVAYLLNVSILN